MMAICNRCKYSWRARKLQISNRRCPICRSYDLDYAEQGTPVLPSRHIPHETGSALIYKRISPKFAQWKKSISEEDYLTATGLMREIIALTKQAERLHASEAEIGLLDFNWGRLALEQRAAAIRSTRNLSGGIQ
jgi:hypothetical protein